MTLVLIYGKHIYEWHNSPFSPITNDQNECKICLIVNIPVQTTQLPADSQSNLLR